MDQLVNVILAIDKVLTELQSVIDCSSGLGGLNQIDGPNCPTPYTQRRVQPDQCYITVQITGNNVECSL